MADVFTPELVFGPNQIGIMTPTAPGAPYRTIQISTEVLGPEINLDPNFLNIPYWNVTGGWVVSGGGTADGSPATGYCYHTGGITIGLNYRWTMTISNRFAGSVTMFLGTVVPESQASVGTFTGTFVAGATGDFGLYSSDNFLGSVSYLSVRQIL